MFEELYNIIFIIIAGLILCRPRFSIGTMRAKNMSVCFASSLIPSGYSLVPVYSWLAIFLWTCLPDLLSMCVFRVFLLVLEAGKMGRLGKGKMMEKVFVILWRWSQRGKRDSRRFLATELGVILGALDLEEQKMCLLSAYLLP